MAALGLACPLGCADADACLRNTDCPNGQACSGGSCEVSAPKKPQDAATEADVVDSSDGDTPDADASDEADSMADADSESTGDADDADAGDPPEAATDGDSSDSSDSSDSGDSGDSG